MYLRKKTLWLIAHFRTLFCVTYELEFIETFYKYKKQDKPDITIVYARINATNKYADEFDIRLNILQHHTTLHLKCLKSEPGQTVTPQALSKELKDYIMHRDNRGGLMVLAIEKVHKLLPAQLNTLTSFFVENSFPFSVMFVIPERHWDRWGSDYSFKRFQNMIEYSFMNLKDVSKFFAENSKGYVFDEHGNFLRWDPL